MTIATTTNRVDAPGNGSATSFSFAPVVIFSASDLQVTIRNSSGTETVLVQGAGSTNYSVTVSSYPGTGSITYPASGGTPLALGSTIVIKRIVPLLQSVSLSNQGAYLPSIQEGEYDYLTAIDQQQQEQINRCLQLSTTDASAPITFPSSTSRANQFLGFDSSGNPIAATAVSGTAVSLAMQPVVTAASTAAALTALGGALASAVVQKTGDTMTGGLHLADLYVTGATTGTTLSFAAGNGNNSGGAFILTDNATGAAFQASIASTTMTVTSVTRGPISAGQYVAFGAGPTIIQITGQLTGATGGTGTYSLASAGTQASAPLQSYSYATSFAAVGILNRIGGQAFGLYGEAILNVAGTAANELDSFNNSGVNPTGTYPPGQTFGTTDHIAITLQLVAGGTAQSQIGLAIAGGGQTHQCGIYVWPTSVTNYGLFIDASAAVGPSQPALIRAKQTVSALTLQTMGAPAAGVAVLNVEDAGAASLASIRANGDFANAGFTVGHDGLLYFTLPTTTTSASAGGATALPATPAGYVTVVVSGTPRKIAYY